MVYRIQSTANCLRFPWTRLLGVSLFALLTSGDMATARGADDPPVPVLDDNWTVIAHNPDLGKLTTTRQQPVDFAIWQAQDGTWQLWSCIRHTACGGKTRLFYRWESPKLTAANWTPKGIVMQAEPKYGETPGGMQAPHVVKIDNLYHMFYGDWEHICHATSRDGKTFQRVIQPSGKTGMFTEGLGNNTRDIMMLKVGPRWYGYYTAYPERQGAVFVRTTNDFQTWSESSVVAFGGVAGTNPYSAECPHVIAHARGYYLFRTQQYGPDNITSVYYSAGPGMFGVNQDRRYLVTRLPIAAPEVIRHNGQDYLAALNPQLDGIRLTRLRWGKMPQPDQPIFPLDDPEHRAAWKCQEGSLRPIFTQSQRTSFYPPQRFFIGTAEVDGQIVEDDRTGVLVSPTFTIQHPQYVVYLSGGTDPRLRLELVDAENSAIIASIRNLVQSNRFQPRPLDASKAKGRQAYLRIVDYAMGGWGHINFGGLYTPRSP